MTIKEPESMDDLVYFTRRTIGDGNVMAWVHKEMCPECGKALMGKPTDKDGNVKIRAKEYVCPECNHTVEKKEYEESLEAQAKYSCPHCKKEGVSTIPFKRKNIDGVPTLRFKCEKCGGNIDVTKKMKDPKKKD